MKVILYHGVSECECRLDWCSRCDSVVITYHFVPFEFYINFTAFSDGVIIPEAGPMKQMWFLACTAVLRHASMVVPESSQDTQQNNTIVQKSFSFVMLQPAINYVCLMGCQGSEPLGNGCQLWNGTMLLCLVSQVFQADMEKGSNVTRQTRDSRSSGFISRYRLNILFSSVYKDNSVSRELKTGVCWANTNLAEAKNALGKDVTDSSIIVRIFLATTDFEKFCKLERQKNISAHSLIDYKEFIVSDVVLLRRLG
ncbi:hypothetical protein DV515_00004071 [Chloebia gouldiae]|uniref:Uncharacterized protein n=1 Tax=Chloebia gouldiae TaxID=44316 RepID=A0A3L8SU46_CHLGU|nr:hypothetical protein DV515_00004071 [Chloebia gouldiae]